MKLNQADLLQVVENTPLVAIDLIVRNDQDKVLLGMRNNRPAQGYWFVPGGRVCKNETLDQAFARLTAEELGTTLHRSAAQLLGVYEHFYSDNFAAQAGSGTHYVVLAYELGIDLPLATLPPAQHHEYRWFAPAELLADTRVHAHTQAYFTSAASS